MIKFNDFVYEGNVDKVFFTSDLHYSHKNITNESSWSNLDGVRPFSLSEMNAYIDAEINKLPSDSVLINCGDQAFGGKDIVTSFIEKVNNSCTHIYVRGNHDHHINAPDILYINIKGQLIQICHYPIISYHQQDKGAWMLHGHCHGELPLSDLKILDVGFDTKAYNHKPYTFYKFSEVARIMETKQIHHRHGA